MDFKRTDVLELFNSKEFINVCAPMVRYSKLQFRNLVKKYNCDLCFTPMILADSFCKSAKARKNEFSTNLVDTPLITQFAANTVHDFVGASYLVSPFCDGVDLNCGCPQRWAKQQGLGCIMLNKPQLIYDIVRQCRNEINKPFTVSVKMRLLQNFDKTLEICKNLEQCGVSFITVHGRTPDQNTGNIKKDELLLLGEFVNIPIIVNGGVKNFKDCQELQQYTKCKGIMVANGILSNPSIFSGTDITPLHCVQNWLNICYNSILSFGDYKKERLKDKALIPERPPNLTFQCFHHHLVFMLEKVLSKKQRQSFNSLQKFKDVQQFIKDNFQLEPQLFDEETFSKYCSRDLSYDGRFDLYKKFKATEEDDDPENYVSFGENENGKYFSNKVKDDCDWSSIFHEN